MFAPDLLAGKSALVTGASSGLGRHFAQLLAAHGARVVAAARRKDELDALVATLARRRDARVALDLRDPASVDAAMAALGPHSTSSSTTPALR